MPIFLPLRTGVYRPPTNAMYCLCFYATLAGLLKTEKFSYYFFYITLKIPQVPFPMAWVLFTQLSIICLLK